jgi:hypothetical protein
VQHGRPHPIHHAKKFPLIHGPRHIPTVEDECVPANELHLLDSRVHFLVCRGVIRPANDRRFVGAGDDGDVVVVIFVHRFDVAYLPGAEHLSDIVVDFLGNRDGRHRQAGGIVFGVFVLFLCEGRRGK